MKARLFVTIAAGAAALLAAPLGAQRTTPRTMIAINPLGIPWDLFAAEVETGISRGTTLGALASYTALDDDGRRFTSFEGKIRYYPSEEWFNRISAGLSLGGTRFDYRTSSPTGVPVTESLTAPTLGILVDYNWVHGPSRRFIVGLGFSAKRVLASRQSRDRVDIDRAYPTGRFVLGWAF